MTEKRDKKVLVIDDDRTVCHSLELLLRRSGYDVKAIHHPNMALEVAEEYSPDVVLLDMNFTIDTSGRHGLKLLALLLMQNPKLSIILITGWATIQLAVEGMKGGAKDFLAKPWDNNELLRSVDTIIQLYHSKTCHFLNSKDDNVIIGQSQSIQSVLSMVDRIARTDASVLLTGESGTGKELIAEAIHQKSKRADGNFVKVNLGGISHTLFESEMFGHLKGAFTGATSDRVGRFGLAHRGTIFLDEIGELTLESQVKLLRVLQEKTYEALGSSKSLKTDVRVISATNRPLKEMVGEGSFREDLYYRINLIEIHLPSLGERREDIPLLVKHFLSKVGRLYDIEEPYVDKETLSWLSEQNYPGNIRQLKNLIDRTALIHHSNKELTIKAFQSVMTTNQSGQTKVILPNVGSISLDEMEKLMVIKALAFHDYSISQTARSLGITRSSLYRRMEKYDIV